MADDVSTPNLPVGSAIDELLGNQNIGGVSTTVRYPASSFVTQVEQAVSDQLTAATQAAIAQNRKASVVVSSIANVVVASGLTNGTVLNGVTLATGNRVLLKAQTLPQENGIYVVAASGAASRATDADTAAEMLGAMVYVEGGTVDAFTTWFCSTNPITTLGTTPLTFIKSAGSDTNVRSDVGTNPNGTGTAPTVFQHLTALERSFVALPTARNLYDPENAGAAQGSFYQVDGSVGTGSATLSTTGKIPVTAGSTYIFTLYYGDQNFYLTLEIFYWNSGGAFLSRRLPGDTFTLSEGPLNQSTAVLTPPAGAAFVSFNVGKLGPNPTAYDFKALRYRAMLSAGFQRLAFEPYAPAYSTLPLAKVNGLTVVKAYPYIYIRDQFSQGIDKVEVFSITTPAYQDHVNSGMAGPVRVHLIGSGTPIADTVSACVAFSGDMVALSADDQAPFWINGQPLGGNHGWPSKTITATGHGKTNADIGSKWTDGASKDWRLVRIVDANTLQIAPYPGGTSTQWTVDITLTGTTLTHVAGATHTGSITFSAPVDSQMYPWAQRQTVQMFLDGIELLADGTYRGDHLEVSQSYGIPNPKAVLDNLFAAVGSLADPSYNYTGIQTQVEISVGFSWRPGELCVVTYSWFNVQDYLQTQVSATQFGPLNVTGTDHLWFFAPRSTTESTTGLNFSGGGADITSNTLNWTLDSGEWTDGTDPPEHFAMILKTSGGVGKRGCLFGYSHLVDRGTPTNRAASISVAVQGSPANKFYPFVVDSHLGSVAAANDHYSVVAYRGYFDASDSSIVCQGIYTWAGKKYWVCDINGNVTNKWVAPRLGALAQVRGRNASVTTGNGKKSSSLTFRSSFVETNGVLVTTTGGGGSFIAEIG